MQGFWRAVLSAHPQPNQALEPMPYSLRFASAFGRGSPRALYVLRGYVHIRAEEEQDWADVHAVNESAFGRLAEAHLVAALREQARPVVSLVAECRGTIVGHIMFSPVVLPGHPELKIMGLAPMNVLSSQVLFDRQGWFTALRMKVQKPYPEELRRVIVAKNFPILRNTLSAYTHQLERAVRRGDQVSINHRVAALLASYFDVVFAINRMPHPGEKRLVQIAEARCECLPDGMSEQVEYLLRAASPPGGEVLKGADLLIAGLEVLLRAEGLLELRSKAVKQPIAADGLTAPLPGSG